MAAKLKKTESAVIRSFGMATMVTPTDVCFSFDTTVSMFPSLAAVRTTIETTAKKLVESLPQLRIAIIAHGDYESEVDGEYCCQVMDFSRDVSQIVQFVQNVPMTSNSSTAECYEKALYEANRLSWLPAASKAVVVFGDSMPHAPSYTTQKYSWRQEVADLVTKDAHIYGVYCHTSNPSSAEASKTFLQEMADLSGGVFVEQADFSAIDKMFMAICYRETSADMLASFEKEVKDEGKERSEVTRMFRSLSAGNVAKKGKTGRVVAAPWWDEETDAKLNAGCLPYYDVDAVTKKWKMLRQFPRDVAELTGFVATKDEVAKPVKGKVSIKGKGKGSIKAKGKGSIKAKGKGKPAKKAVTSKKGKTKKKAAKVEEKEEEKEEDKEKEDKKTKKKTGTKRKSKSSKKEEQEEEVEEGGKKRSNKRRTRPRPDFDSFSPYSKPELPAWFFSGKRAAERLVNQ